MAVNTSTDATGKFSVFGEGTLSAIGFDETAFKGFLLSLAQPTEASSTFSDLTIDLRYRDARFHERQTELLLGVQGSLEPIFSADNFSGTIAGEKIGDAKTAISSLSQLQEGTISVWPAWLWQIPANTKKIQVTVD